MALQPDSVYRGVAAAIQQPATEEDICLLQNNIVGLTLYNTQGPSILYRDPTDDQDILERVYRWDDRPYAEIFITGFQPRDRGSTSWHYYYNLERHVNSAGAPANDSSGQVSAFVSTTRSASFRPWVTIDMIIYRYEIFAPGGIDAVLTLREHNFYPSQSEISFVGGIAPQYIRSAIPYAVVTDGDGGRYPYYTPLGNIIYQNGNFNPNPTAEDGLTSQDFLRRLRNIRCPKNGQIMISVVQQRRQKRSVANLSDNDSTIEKPFDDSGNYKVEYYISCAFNFNDGKEEAFIFTGRKCMHINYAPHTTDDYIIEGPILIRELFPYLKYTIFATGIDAAFVAYAKNEAYIFRGNIYAVINFVEGYIVGGPKMIIDAFHSLKNTIFEHGIDAAFASTRSYEAYIFKGDKYALIDYAPGSTNDKIIGGIKKITDGYKSLTNTVFEDGIDAAFSVKGKNEAYIFKGNTYALINYAPGTTDDRILNMVTPITDGFHSLRGNIPSELVFHARAPEVDVSDIVEKRFVDGFCYEPYYVECAFNFNDGQEEAFIFTINKCMQINYAPGTTEDYVIKGPMSIGDFFPFLKDTIFASGIDAAFVAYAKNEAYIFRSNIYALINFVDGYIVGGPKMIIDGFYSLKNTIFEHGIDAAFASTRTYEAYIFKGDKYALIDYAPGSTNDKIIGGIKKITDGYKSLRDTIFKDGIDAAFSVKGKDEAYIFKGNTYALINYAPGTTDDRIINMVTPITDGFHSLRGIIPCYPCDC